MFAVSGPNLGVPNVFCSHKLQNPVGKQEKMDFKYNKEIAQSVHWVSCLRVVCQFDDSFVTAVSKPW